MTVFISELNSSENILSQNPDVRTIQLVCTSCKTKYFIKMKLPLKFVCRLYV